MAPQKTNFKSYEAAMRLLAAVIATTNPKLNFNGKLFLGCFTRFSFHLYSSPRAIRAAWVLFEFLPFPEKG